MKIISRGFRKRFLALLVFQFIFASFIVFNVKVDKVSAAPVSPYIKIVPEQTVNSTLTVGSTYTFSVVTDHNNGSDIWSWQFSLTFNPDILQGGVNTTDTWNQTSISKKTWYATKPPIIAGTEKIYWNDTLVTKPANYTIDYGNGKITFTAIPPKGTIIKANYMGYSVVNGDLITFAKDPTATFVPGIFGFNNTAGTLSLVGANFAYATLPPPRTSGPGILANVTFRVVGTGYSNITLGDDTRLLGITDAGAPYDIINAATMPTHIGHGYFDNLPNVHDLAVSKLVAPSMAIPGDVVAINVTVRNEGNFTENFDVAVHVNSTLVGSQATSLARGEKSTLRFDWNTTDALAGNYVINATALLAEDVDLSDNSMIGQIEVRYFHDVAITNFDIPTRALIGDLVPINVTVKNEGNIEENVTLTLSYEQIIANPQPIVFNTTNFMLAERPTSQVILVSWNTTGLISDAYRINATATIVLDEDLSENTWVKVISLTPPIHDVSVVSVSATSSVLVGQQVAINVTVRNDGTFNETLFEVKVTYDSTTIGSQSVSLLVGENKTLSFTWDTTGVVADIYSISAEAILTGDATPGNNLGVAAVTVQAPPQPPPGHIAGRVTDSSNSSSIVGANVTTNGYSDLTDSNGYFNITNVPAGTYNVTASASGYQSSTRTGIVVVSGDTTDLNFALTPVPVTPAKGLIAGIVIDFSTGDPIVGATVTVNSNSTSTDANGSYNIELEPGTYTVTASAQGYESSTQTGIVVNSGETTTLNFRLTQVTEQQADISAYMPLIIGAIIAIIVIVGIAVYFLKIRK